mmetsp:Transcript_35263/g.69186  ORF Transcript_35263/g.69186 Transcript_35263/m.69186 type:complete len:175 (+) Transcript_35263:51-575(+)
MNRKTEYDAFALRMEEVSIQNSFSNRKPIAGFLMMALMLYDFFSDVAFLSTFLHDNKENHLFDATHDPCRNPNSLLCNHYLLNVPCTLSGVTNFSVQLVADIKDLQAAGLNKSSVQCTKNRDRPLRGCFADITRLTETQVALSCRVGQTCTPQTVKVLKLHLAPGKYTTTSYAF